MKKYFLVLLALVSSILLGYAAAFAQPRTSSARLSIKDFLPRKTIDTSILGVNAFVNDQRFGTISSQLLEVKNTLRLNYVRVLFAWNDDVQPDPNVAPDFSFYDEIARSLPKGMSALVILTGVPSWMSDSSNWINGNPRKTFAELWVRKVVSRYRRNAKIKAWEIWNEPNMSADSDNDILQVTTSPSNYLELLTYSVQVVRSLNPRKLVVAGATTAINQGFPRALNYNKALKNSGLESLVDIWNIHIYGTHLENFIRPGGVTSWLNKVRIPIWITETGETGVNEQLDYAERMWPFLKSSIKGLKRIYQYQFTEATDANSTFGLRNLTEGFTVSDLYIYLRDR